MDGTPARPTLLIARDEADARRLKMRLAKWDINTDAMDVAVTPGDVALWRSIHHGEIIEGDSGVDARIEVEQVRVIQTVFVIGQSIEVITSRMGDLARDTKWAIRRMEHLTRFALKVKRDLYGGDGSKTGALKVIEDMREQHEQYREDVRTILGRLTDGDKALDRLHDRISVGIWLAGIVLACLTGLLYLILHFHVGV